jgi:hypothetical protein
VVRYSTPSTIKGVASHAQVFRLFALTIFSSAERHV